MPVPHHSVCTGRMPFLPPNQQHQTTEGILTYKTAFGVVKGYWDLWLHCWILLTRCQISPKSCCIPNVRSQVWDPAKFNPCIFMYITYARVLDNVRFFFISQLSIKRNSTRLTTVMAGINSESKMLQEMFYIAGQEKKSQWGQKKMLNTM